MNQMIDSLSSAERLGIWNGCFSSPPFETLAVTAGFDVVHKAERLWFISKGERVFAVMNSSEPQAWIEVSNAVCAAMNQE